MSIALMTQVWKSELPSVTKMVLLALCDNANDQGECYPSVQMLAQKCSLSDRAVQKHITDLEVMGVVSRGMRNGRSTVYYIDLRTLFTPEPHSPQNVVHPTPERRSPQPPNIVHPTPEPCSPITIKEPSIEPSMNHKKDKKGSGDTFDAVGLLISLGTESQVASDFVKQRKAKLTKTAIDGIAREAVKAGISISDALMMACERGWSSFRADWMAPKAKVAPQRPSAHNGFENKDYAQGVNADGSF